MHKPVLLNEVIDYLAPKSGENFIDCTVGAGGHSLAILEKNNPGKVLAIDWDEESLQLLKLKIKNQKLKINGRLILISNNFKNLKQIVKENNFHPINGILFDFGLSGWQIEESGRGFTFRKDEPLAMNFGEQDLGAAEIINKWPEKSLREVFLKYGEERYSRRIAKRIVEERQRQPIKTTFQLKDAIEKAIPYRWRADRVLARIFQSLRIVVNDELENLKQGIEQAVEILVPGGRLVVISFHSLEDRIAKSFFKENKSLKILSKKPIMASEEEIKSNPRSRSAKLRAAIKL
jgi:16S rRNA (cytosine1402-N4)-methyltransferase